MGVGVLAPFLGWLIKNVYMALLAFGPFGSVNEPLLLPPDQACPIPLIFQYSSTSLPLLLFQVWTVKECPPEPETCPLVVVAGLLKLAL